MQFEAAESHLRAVVSSRAGVTIRAEAASMLARCAVVSGGGSADVILDALASLADRAGATGPRALARTGLRRVDARRDRSAAAFSVERTSAAVSGSGARSPRVRGGRGNPHRPGAVDPGRAGASRSRRSGGRARRRVAAVRASRTRVSWLCTRCDSRSAMSSRSDCSTSDWRGRVGRVTRPGRASSTASAPRSRSRGDRFTTPRSRPRPACDWSRNSILRSCSSSRWRLSCTSSAESSTPPASS